MSLDGSIRVFEKSSNGLALRTETISLLNALLMDSEFSANDISGYVASEFVTKENLFAEHSSLKESLEYVLAKDIDESLYSALSDISDVKDGIRNAINELYGSIAIPSTGESSYFENYVDALNAMPDLLSVRALEAAEFSENGEYVAEDGKAYGEIAVNIPEKTLTTRVIKENGTYYAQQDGADGYEFVQVSVTGSVPSYTVRFWSEDRSNILYTALNVPHGGYAQFDGTYPEHEGLYFSKWDPIPTNVTSDMDCYPVFSNVPSDDVEITDSWETIIANRGVGYPIGSYKNIVFDSSTLIVNPVKNGNQPDGTIKIWDIGPMKAVKAATGEGGSSSTWLVASTDCDYTTIYNEGRDEYNYQNVPFPWGIALQTYNSDGNPYNDPTEICWKNSATRNFLNDKLFNALPTILKNAIIAVPKNSSGANVDEGENFNSQTRDKLWALSLAEILGTSSRQLYGQTMAENIYYRKCIDNCVFNGVDYSKLFFDSNYVIYNDQTIYPFRVPSPLLLFNTCNYIITRDIFQTDGLVADIGRTQVTIDSEVKYLPQFGTTSGGGYGTISPSNIDRLIFGFCL